MSKEKVLSDLYFDVEDGFGSVKSLHEQAKEKGLSISLNEVKEWVKKQSINQRRGYKNFNSYSASYAREVYSVDIMDMISLMKDTDTYDESYKRYALVCVDNFSIKKMITDRALITKGAWTILLKPSLDTYNNTMEHSTTGTTPDKAHKDENSVKAKANSLLKEKYLRKYPNIKEGDKVKIYVKGKGNYTSRKESRNQWSERSSEVKEIKRDMQLNKHYILDGLSKRYNRHEILLLN